MSKYYGNILEDSTIELAFNTFDSDGASVTVTDLATTDVEVYKDGTILADPDAGVTLSLNVGTGDGSHLVIIDTSADAEYAVGSNYEVRLVGITVDTQTINAFIGSFSIENRFMRGTDIGDLNDFNPASDAVANVTLVDTVGSTGYANGDISIDTVNGTAGTVSYSNGTADNPVDSLTDALTLSGAVNILRFEVAPKSDITFAGDMDGYTFHGSDYVINCAGYDTDSLLLEGATVKGELTTSGSVRMLECSLFTGATLPGGTYEECTLPGDLTLPGTFYVFNNCLSAVDGADPPSIDLTNVGAVNVNFPHYSGDIEVKGLKDGDSMSLEGDGQLVINADCEGGTIVISGNFTVTDNVVDGFLGTTSEEARFAAKSEIDRLRDIQEADRVIDFPGGTLKYKEKDSGLILLQKNLKDPNNAAVDSTEDVIASEVNSL